MAEKTPSVYMIGGPNGAGKTTMALSLLPRFLDTHEFVNADEIARGLNPLNPRSADFMAGRMMIDRIKALTETKTSFAFETTCAGRHHVQTFQKCAFVGYKTHLLFLWLPSPDVAIDRVAWRVKQGGHDIPADTIRRRYYTGLKNLIEVYLPLADDAIIINGSEGEENENNPFAVIAQKFCDGNFVVFNSGTWDKIERDSKGGPHV